VEKAVEERKEREMDVERCEEESKAKRQVTRGEKGGEKGNQPGTRHKGCREYKHGTMAIFITRQAGGQLVYTALDYYSPSPHVQAANYKVVTPYHFSGKSVVHKC
jgi:hypothetical protein